jgi:hypothetical protein
VRDDLAEQVLAQRFIVGEMLALLKPALVGTDHPPAGTRVAFGSKPGI